ncbi:PTS system IIA component (Gat family) [Sinobaca qinghaiensis]|uniref:PTS system IIA component (Gat family) n=1 Tax=Sinobaca qinghaiensis TaxID=342944 RepID=A0A419UX54_9BACL|nr:PTS sugar transporter subunit IIA [Sinobaca qinghaiensis]RKD69718.1 PTS system IIA component (Gat family) [Sinobaca qinghaiensis]
MTKLFFDESVILMEVNGETKEAVLEEMGNNLIQKGLVKDSFVKAVIAREKEFATGLPTAGVAVAIPHTDVEHVNTKTISVGILKKPVAFGIMGEEEETVNVELVFMLAMDETHSQLALLQKLMEIFQNEETLKYLMKETDATRIKETIEQQIDFTTL